MENKKVLGLLLLASTVLAGAIWAMSSSKRYEYTIPAITNAEYASIVKSGKKIAVVYNATWCPSCMAQHKAVTQIYEKYKAKLGIYVVDWDKVDEFAGPKVKQRTTIAIIQKDKILEELIGENRVEKISELFDRHSN